MIQLEKSMGLRVKRSIFRLELVCFSLRRPVMTKKMPITLTTRAEHCFCHCFISFSIFQRLFFILIHTLALVTIFLNNLSCICIFLFQFVFFIYPVLCHVYLCFCVIVSLCICVSVLTSPWWGCRPSRVYSGRKYRRTELIICPVLCK